MRSFLVVIVLACTVLTVARPARADFYIAPNGDDTNPGTKQEPLRSIAEAQQRVREQVQAGLDSDLRVVLREGTFRPEETLEFGPEDSGTAEHAVIYTAHPGERVIVSGGEPVKGWKRNGNVWVAEIPGVKSGDRYFRQIYVNGRRAVRARTPNLDGEPSRWQMTGASLADDMSRYTLTLEPGLLKSWSNIEDAEVMFSGNWAINRKRLQAVKPDEGLVVMAPPHRSGLPWNAPRKGRWCYFENAPEMLDSPSEWYLDRDTGELRYWPREGENMQTANVIAPRLPRLVRIQGIRDNPVRNLHFRGIAFQHTDWSMPPGGYRGVQACHFGSAGSKGEGRWLRMPAAIRLDDAEDCSFERCTLAHLGSCGIELDTRCKGNVIRRCEVFDVAGNGIMVGGPKGEEDVPKDNRIENCEVHHCGARYHGAVGIWVGITQRTIVEHNHVHNHPYTGVSVGWQWNPQPTACRENVVANNHIHEVMKQLADGGCIYTLGFQPDTVIRGNHLHGVRRGPFCQGAPNNGIFFDQGSKGFLVENNVIYDTSAAPIRFNQCQHDWHTWKNNFFGVHPDAKGVVGKALICDGETYVRAAHSPELDPPDLTAEAWIRLSHLPRRGESRRWIVNKNKSEWHQGHWGLVMRGSSVGAYLNIGGGKENAYDAFSDSGAIAPGEWHHLAMTYGGGDLKVYLDGTQVASKTINKKREAGTSPVNIGRRQDGYTYFVGLIDEVRIFNEVLTQTEIESHAENPETAPTEAEVDGLVRYWGFEDQPDVSEDVMRVIDGAGPVGSD